MATFHHSRNNFILTNFTDSDSPIVFTASVMSAELSIAGLGFIISDRTSKLLYAGCCGYPTMSDEDATAKALCFALQATINWNQNVTIKTVLSPNAELIKAIKQRSYVNAWRLNL